MELRVVDFAAASRACHGRPPRPRPTSAKPSSRKVLSARPEHFSYSRNDGLDEEEEEVVDDDDGDDEDEFGAAVEREHQLQQQMQTQLRRNWSAKPQVSDAKVKLKSKFRPSSAPAARPKSALTSRISQEDKQKRSLASISIGYLRAAAEKKKTRDREFAVRSRELFREENEFRKKISVKIEQANKMMTAIGSSKSFGPAPDRDGIHMIKVLDPGSGDRFISMEIFLREFETLATVPLGQTMQLQHSSSNNSKQSATSSRTKNSLQRSSLAPRATRLGTRASSAFREPSSDLDGTRSRAAKIKPADRTQVQEELRSVLEGTIELTKVLQEQLHELKLKGWNVAPRS